MENGKKCGGPIKTLTWVLLVIGALNWGLVGAFEFDLVAKLFGEMTTLARVVYVLVGLAGLMSLVHCMTCKRCKESKQS